MQLGKIGKKKRDLPVSSIVNGIHQLVGSFERVAVDRVMHGVRRGKILVHMNQRNPFRRRQRTVGSAGALAAGYARRDDLLRRIGAARQFVGRRAKGIGIDDAAAGGGVVTATVNGKHELKNLEIDPEAVDPDDVEMLQDLIVAAVNEAMRSADNDASSSMQKLTGGLGLPF